MPAGSKTDPLLAKGELINDGGSASGIMYLRRGKKPGQQQLQPKRGVTICERKNSADTKVSAEEGGRGGAPGTRAEIPLQPMEDDGGADIYLQPVEDPTLEQVDARRRL
ncbi:hypothetical protein GRJ2_001397600 [Grus japonensis]|uniref:Uncharacterized protein n=1 Tax=Grus japonensis TaxID=30415 RepID=A0ABC9WVB9_GRUJA